MREIPLSRGKFAIVDDDDYEWLMEWKWDALSNKDGSVWYAHHQWPKPSISMHRAILGFQFRDKRMVDHINGNGLDNRRANLREATNRTNQLNQRKHLDSSNPYKGVFGRNGWWWARVSRDGKRIWSPPYRNPEDAYAAYCSMAQEHYGEFAGLK